MIRVKTTTTDWQPLVIDIEDSRYDEYFSLHLTPDFEPKLQQGLSEGWIVVVPDEEEPQ